MVLSLISEKMLCALDMIDKGSILYRCTVLHRIRITHQICLHVCIKPLRSRSSERVTKRREGVASPNGTTFLLLPRHPITRLASESLCEFGNVCKRALLVEGESPQQDVESERRGLPGLIRSMK